MPRWYLYSTLEEEKKKKMDDVCKNTLQSETRGQNKNSAGVVLWLSHWEAKACSDQTCAASGGHEALQH